jgi:hypothetical protein
MQLSAQRIVAHQDCVGPFRVLFAPLSANRLLSCCAVVHNRTAVTYDTHVSKPTLVVSCFTFLIEKPDSQSAHHGVVESQNLVTLLILSSILQISLATVSHQVAHR